MKCLLGVFVAAAPASVVRHGVNANRAEGAGQTGFVLTWQLQETADVKLLCRDAGSSEEGHKSQKL